MEEKKKKFNWTKFGNIVATIVVVFAWLLSYVSMCRDTFTGSKLLCLAIISFAGFCYLLTTVVDPYLTRIEELEEDKLELQAKINQLEMPMTHNECKRKKSSKTKKQ